MAIEKCQKALHLSTFFLMGEIEIVLTFWGGFGGGTGLESNFMNVKSRIASKDLKWSLIEKLGSTFDSKKTTQHR
jgi:hypothetical protein